MKKKAIICDLDGTLALLNGRDPLKEQSKCGEDLLQEFVADVLFAMWESDYELLLVSGRYDTYQEQTEQWLVAHDIPYSFLALRQANDYRSDDIIKREIYENHIEPHYDVQFVIDDRPKVIRMWKELGLKVLDVGDGMEF